MYLAINIAANTVAEHIIIKVYSYMQHITLIILY